VTGFLALPPPVRDVFSVAISRTEANEPRQKRKKGDLNYPCSLMRLIPVNLSEINQTFCMHARQRSRISCDS
jgi:hypothetical protein